MQTRVSKREKKKRGKQERERKREREIEKECLRGRQGEDRREIGDMGGSNCALVEGVVHCMAETQT